MAEPFGHRRPATSEAALPSLAESHLLRGKAARRAMAPHGKPPLSLLAMVAMLLVFGINVVSGQDVVESTTLTINFGRPNTCDGNQYWDASNLACINCPAVSGCSDS